MFPKVLKKILWILLWGGLLAFPTLEASAQFDASAILRNQNNQNPNDPNNPNNMLGSNPFQTQNGEEQPAMPTDPDAAWTRFKSRGWRCDARWCWHHPDCGASAVATTPHSE